MNREVFEKDMIDRMARVETLLQELKNNQIEHNKRHYDFGTRSIFAIISSGVAILIAIFK